MEEIPYGYCHCGCGNKTKPAPQTWTRDGYRKGDPMRFIKGHVKPDFHGPKNPRWNGGKTTGGGGYIRLIHDKSKVGGGAYRGEHVFIAEAALGKPLPVGAVVHHVDSNITNNQSSNLVVCQDQAYHQFLHQRTRAFSACGHAGWLNCRHCKKYDDPKNLYVSKNGRNHYHRSCANEYNRNRSNAKNV